MAKSLWAEGGSATPAELSTAALRSAPFLKTPAADLARSILDAGVEFHAHFMLEGRCACVSDCSRLHPLCPQRISPCHLYRSGALERRAGGRGGC